MASSKKEKNTKDKKNKKKLQENLGSSKESDDKTHEKESIHEDESKNNKKKRLNYKIYLKFVKFVFLYLLKRAKSFNHTTKKVILVILAGCSIIILSIIASILVVVLLINKIYNNNTTSTNDSGINIQNYGDIKNFIEDEVYNYERNIAIKENNVDVKSQLLLSLVIDPVIEDVTEYVSSNPTLQNIIDTQNQELMKEINDIRSYMQRNYPNLVDFGGIRVENAYKITRTVFIANSSNRILAIKLYFELDDNNSVVRWKLEPQHQSLEGVEYNVTENKIVTNEN